MVFTKQRRRKGRRPVEPPKTPQHILNYMSHELLMQILDYLPTNDILNAQLVCRNFASVCATLISDRMDRLYIHPTPASFRGAFSICQHPVWSKAIREVVLLGRINWRDIDSLYGNTRAIRDNHSRLSTWPASPPRQGNSAASSRWNTIEYEVGTARKGVSYDWSTDAFNVAYDEFIDALAKLPNLRKLSFREQCGRPGYNRKDMDAIAKHSYYCLWAEKTNKRFSDATVFHALMCSPRLRIEEVSLCTELPFTNILEEEVRLVRDPVFPTISHRLKKADLTLHCGWSGSHPQSYCRSMLGIGETLTHLKLSLRPDLVNKSLRADQIIGWFLGSWVMVSLEHLELRLLPEYGSSKDRPSRPVVADLSFHDFLKERCPKLRSLHVENVVFVNWSLYPRDRISARGITEMAIKVLREREPPLEEVVWNIAWFRHHHRCKQPTDGPYSGACQRHCGWIFAPGKAAATGIGSFESLADEYSIEVNRDTRHWDFGKAVTGYRQDTAQSTSSGTVQE